MFASANCSTQQSLCREVRKNTMLMASMITKSHQLTSQRPPQGLFPSHKLALLPNPRKVRKADLQILGCCLYCLKKKNICACSEPRPRKNSCDFANYASPEHRLNKYMETLHHALPMFTHSVAVANSSCNQQILYTICVLMAKLENFSFSSVNDAELEAHIQLLLGSCALDEEFLGHLALNEMRKICLTSFYEFHQFPGHQAWEKIGKLVRTAYWMGLDRLDDPDRLTLDLPAAGLIDGASQTFRDEDIDEWRLLWWTIYGLDSYANFAAGMPYMVHEDTAATQLLRSVNGANDSADSSSDRGDGLYLNSDLRQLRLLIPVVAGVQDSTRLFNLHLVTIAALRRVKKGLEQRFNYRHRKTNAEIQYSTSLERELNALRLTLPANYLNPMRNALTRETQLEHHSRLVSILHLHMARLIIAIYNCGTLEDGEEWLLKWQQILDSAQEIAMVTEQWNTAYTLSVDPAISFIIFTALVFVHLHKKSSLPREIPPDDLEHAETVLLLHLEHFANIWTLPRLLIRAYHRRSFNAVNFAKADCSFIQEYKRVAGWSTQIPTYSANRHSLCRSSTSSMASISILNADKARSLCVGLATSSI